ncbi:porin [Dechloromonas sp. A34]|uniref:porin n=1 Tax=Dechloromonas sp. A34 TaxID=447588 RepID=UPI00224988CE|nr:porin [Dechloromonas sp. A34]
MQKKIIALAIAGLASTAAFAQTNVTVYGVVDLGQAFVKSTTTGGADRANAEQPIVGRLDNNSSYLGFKGVEDLGNGLKAVFQLETGYNSDNAGGWGGARDTYVGLTGGFGTLVAGNLTHSLRAFGAKVELTPGAAGFGTMTSVTGTLAGIKTGADDRAANAVAYVSPNFGGFTGTVAYVNGETRTGANAVGTNQGGTNSRQYQIAGQFENGPLFVGAGYHLAKSFGLTSPNGLGTPSLNENGQDASVIRVAAVYTLPTKTKLTGLYDYTQVKTGDVGGAALDVDKIKRHAWSVGVAQPFGKSTVGLEYGRSHNVKADGDAIADSSTQIYTAVYTYDLSKRTALHARASYLNNGTNVNNAFYLNPVNNGVTQGDGNDYTGYMVGLRHTF